LSPDGKWAAAALYDLELAGTDLWIFDVKTNAARRLSSESAGRDCALWSPDSKKIAFMYGSPTETKGPRIRLRGLGELDAEETTPAADFQIPLDWSSDGRFIAFMNTGSPRFANEQQSDVSVIDMAQGKKICRC
jgi:Tol biopolymer transport system component